MMEQKVEVRFCKKCLKPMTEVVNTQDYFICGNGHWICLDIDHKKVKA